MKMMGNDLLSLAIQHLRILQGKNVLRQSIIDDLDMVLDRVEQLEKIPKDVIEVHQFELDSEIMIGKCPCCKDFLANDKRRGTVNYCGRCGQRIKWNE